MQLLAFWFILRCLSTLVVAVVSTIRPLTPIEKTVTLIPVTAPLGQWLNRAILSPWLRWDAVWFERIVTQGYSATDGTAPYHPLYPWLATPLKYLGISPVLSLLIISSLAGIAFLFIFYRLMKLELTPKEAFFGILLFTLVPVAFVLYAPYAEALFLLLAALCIYWSRKKSWWLAGLAGGLAVLTRQQGIILLLPVALELWEDADRKIIVLIKKWKSWLALGLIPMGMVVWLAYRAINLNDIQANFSSFQSFIFSFVISPSTMQVISAQRFIWPWQAAYLALTQLITHPDIDLWINMLTSSIFLLILALAWRNMRLSYKVYCLAITLVSFSYYTGPIHPYMGLPRHLLLAFPVFVSFVPILNTAWKRILVISLSTMGWFVLLIAYNLQAWVP